LAANGPDRTRLLPSWLGGVASSRRSSGTRRRPLHARPHPPGVAARGALARTLRAQCRLSSPSLPSYQSPCQPRVALVTVDSEWSVSRGRVPRSGSPDACDCRLAEAMIGERVHAKPKSSCFSIRSALGCATGGTRLTEMKGAGHD
jgi:hypothetical protein